MGVEFRAAPARPQSAADTRRDAEIAAVERFRQESTSAHLGHFRRAVSPVVPAPPLLTADWSLEQARSYYTQGLSPLNRSARAAAKQRAQAAAPAYLAAERQRLAGVYATLQEQGGLWWQKLLRNEAAVVIEAMDFAFSGQSAFACVIGVEGATASVVMRQPDPDSWPAKVPALTPTGRPTLKALNKRDRNRWWLTSLCSHVAATLRKGFAVAPGLQAIDIAALTRVPTTQRIGVVAYGSWSRDRVESAAWRSPEDAVRVLDIADDVECAVTTTSTGIKALDVARVPGLREVLARTGGGLAELDETLVGSGRRRSSSALPEPYVLAPFATWVAAQAAPPAPREVVLVRGQNSVLELDASGDVDVTLTASGTAVDLSLLLLQEDHRVASDDDFVFYNQPASPCGTVRLHPAQAETGVHRARLQLHTIPQHVRTVAIVLNVDVASDQTFAALRAPRLSTTAAGRTWSYAPETDPQLRAMVLAEIYRAPGDPGGATWKVRAVGQGWADGLPGLARDHGVALG